MLDNNRLNLLYQKFAVSEVMPDDQLSGLTLEELTFIYAMTETAKKDERFSQIHFPIRQQIIYWAAVDAFKNAEALYVAYSKMPMYPYVDPMGSVWMFSEEELAKRLVDNLKTNQQVDLIVRKVENKMIMPMVAQMHYIGVDRFVIDNGAHPMLLKRTDILPEPEWKKEDGQPNQDFTNGPLQMAMIHFFQYMQLNATMQKALAAPEVTDEEKKNLQQKLKQGQQVLKMMETRLLSLLVDAKFLVPSITLKDGQPLPPGQTASGEGITRKLANVVDANKVTWLPAFTDWPEFIKTYRPNEWGAIVLSYEALVKMAKDTGIGKIVFNPRGCGFRVDEQMIERIEEFRQKKAEFEARRAEEKAKKEAEAQEGVKPAAEEKHEAAPAEKDTADESKEVVYGDLLDAPEMMIGALKRTAKALKSIKKMWLAQRVEGSNRGYLLVVEAMAETDKAIEELKKASAGYLGDKIMEVRQADPSALQLVKDIKPFYKKGLFG